MIKIQTFKVEDFQAANDFMAEHPPRMTEKQSGLQWHNGNIIIIYEDGQENPIEVKSNLICQMMNEKEHITILDYDVRLAKKTVESLQPSDYTGKESPRDLALKIQKESECSWNTAEGLASQIESFRNKILISSKEMERLKGSVEVLQEMIAEIK